MRPKTHGRNSSRQLPRLTKKAVCQYGIPRLVNRRLSAQIYQTGDPKYIDDRGIQCIIGVALPGRVSAMLDTASDEGTPIEISDAIEHGLIECDDPAWHIRVQDLHDRGKIAELWSLLTSTVRANHYWAPQAAATWDGLQRSWKIIDANRMAASVEARV